MLLVLALSLVPSSALLEPPACGPRSQLASPLELLVSWAGSGALGDLADPALLRIAKDTPDRALREAANWALARRRLAVGLVGEELPLVQHLLASLRSADDAAIRERAYAHLQWLTAEPDLTPLREAGPWAEREGRALVVVFLGAAERSQEARAQLAGLLEETAELPVAWWFLHRTGDEAPGEPLPGVDWHARAGALAEELGILTWPQAWIFPARAEAPHHRVPVDQLDWALAVTLAGGGHPDGPDRAPAPVFSLREEGEELYLISVAGEAPRPSSSTTVRGRVLWHGPPPLAPELEPLRVGSGCDVPEGFVARRRGIELGPEGGVRDVVAARPGAAQGRDPLPFDAFEMSIRGARFEPRVLLVPAGARVRFENRDDCGHIVHLQALRNPAMNSSVSPQSSVGVVLERRERVRVVDDVHPWMEGWVVVHDGAAMRTDESGFFELDGLPAGENALLLWHPDPRIGELTVPVQIAEGELQELVVHIRRWR